MVCHDADEPGQAGATRWAGAIAARQADGLETRIVVLPHAVTATKGKDLRDWLAEGHGYDDLLALAKAAQPVEASAIPDDEPRVEVPAAISNGEEVITETPGGEEQTKIVPVALGDLEIAVAETTHDWPRRVGRSLFVMRDGDQVGWLEKSPALFGWLQIFGRVDWFEKTGFVKKAEFFEELRSTVEQFDSIEKLPHEPPLPKHYYVTRKSVESDGSFLTKLVGFFRPETTIDSDLIKALFATLFWGGPPGSRPAWVLTSDAGRGVGKSKLAQAASHLVGGHIDVSNNEDVETLKSRLLSAEGLDKRVALIDNAKSHRLSWAELEALVTATTISGKRLYVGEASRPNSLNWVVTLNAPSLSTDLAQRSVIIKLAAGKNRPTWWEELIGFIDQDREAIIADCLDFLRSSSTQQLGEYSRWAAWEEAVLCRLPKPAESQKLIIERQASCDADQDESDLIEDYFRSRLHGLGYDHERHSVRIPVTTVAQWYNLATGDKQKTQGVTKRLKQYADEKQMHCLQPDPSRRYGRCFIWVGEHCDITERTQNDLGHRVKEAKQRGDDEDA